MAGADERCQLTLRAMILGVALSIVLAGVLLLGLLRREKHGIANIGFESMLVIVLYGLGAVYLTLGT